jgi:hypothetical protein
LGAVQLAGSEIPQLVSNECVAPEWSEMDPPEVSVKLSPLNEPECIVVAWYLHGFLIGRPNYKPTLTDPNYQKEVTNGVYVYFLYK